MEETGEEPEGKYLVCYEDRFHGLLDMSLQLFTLNSDIPQHRVQQVKLADTGEIVWDRKRKFTTL